MLILGIETATPQVGVAVGGHEGVLVSFHVNRRPRHAEMLAPGIEFVLRQARIEIREISVVAVDVGPGLFTGLRVGIATAKGIAQALRVPMIGVASLDLLAFSMRQSPKLIVAVIDARRGEVFVGRYRQVPGGVQRLSEHRVASPRDVATELASTREECLVVGDGAIRYAEEFRDAGRVELVEAGQSSPSAAALVQLAHARALREDFVQPTDLHPVYLRKADAEINWEVRTGA
ncbi:MAG TPA: tRNA (adenosine(37)-N6)-threonylcarbamoyltransferase complex dimerization subunit type 1 TsaB [Acidimicrobiales bacterium]